MASSISARLVPAANTCVWVVRFATTIWLRDVIIKCPRLTPLFENNLVEGSTTQDFDLQFGLGVHHYSKAGFHRDD